MAPHESDISGGRPPAQLGDATDNRRQGTAGTRRRCLEVCDELHGNSYVADGDEDFTDEMTGATLLRDHVAKARAEDIAWYNKFEAYVEVTDMTCL